MITDKKRWAFQIAAEKIIIDDWAVDDYKKASSRVLADRIVDMVVDSLNGKRAMPHGEELKPWTAFAVKFPTE